MEKVLLRMEHVHKSFGDVEVVKDFSTEVRQGEKVILAGASGSGKTTILRMINHLETPTKGKIWLDGDYIGGHFDEKDQWVPDSMQALAEKRKQIGMVFQSFNLFAHLSALNNVTLGLTKVLKLSKKEAVERAEHHLEKVHLLDHKKKYPHQMSGGQQQRVAIARALAMEPKLMLFDEPTSALDPKLTNEVLEVMQVLAEEQLTMVVVTHEMGFARHFADRMIYLEDGLFVEEGPPDELFTNPKNPKTAHFLSFCGFKEG